MENSRPHAAILGSPGIGHRIPVLELGKRLVTNHGFQVTILFVTTRNSPQEFQLLGLDTPPNLLHVIHLPPVDVSGLVDADAAVVTQIAVTMRKAVPGVRSSIASLKVRPTVLIVDFFGNEALDIANELGVPKYVYFTTSAWFFVLTRYIPILDKEVEGEYVDRKEPLPLPGCKPVRPEDVVDPMLDRTDQQYREYVRLGVKISTADGILVNTWEDMECRTLGALRVNENLRGIIRKPVYPIGPLTKPLGPPGPRSDVLKWLDMQPTESVIYVSFGSGGTLSVSQMTEVALGLEQSGQRFVWVVRPPTEGDASGTYFKLGDGRDGPSSYLPEGFLIRTHKVGLVVSLWASQLEVLSHPSVGGFLSHCGWNSTLESIVNGVPMVAWPLYAEQKLNATLLTEELGVAIRPKELPSKKVVGREEIEKMVRKVMEEKEGKAMRDRVKQLQCSAIKALSKDGCSYNSLCQLVSESRQRPQPQATETQTTVHPRGIAN